MLSDYQNNLFLYKMKEENYFITRNLQLASFLCASKIQFVGTIKVKGVFSFKFFPKEKAEEMADLYFTDSAQINPKELFSKHHDLKDLIFSQT